MLGAVLGAPSCVVQLFQKRSGGGYEALTNGIFSTMCMYIKKTRKTGVSSFKTHVNARQYYAPISIDISVYFLWHRWLLLLPLLSQTRAAFHSENDIWGRCLVLSCPVLSSLTALVTNLTIYARGSAAYLLSQTTPTPTPRSGLEPLLCSEWLPTSANVVLGSLVSLHQAERPKGPP